MNKRNEAGTTNNMNRPSKRNRLNSLLFDGANLGTTLLVPEASQGPKMPYYESE
jgi:hypothetical protein